MKTLELPNGLQIIKKESFKGCNNLKSVTIPATVEFIYQEAFAECYGLEEVIALPEIQPFLYDNSFSNFSVPLKVPKGCKEAYQNARGWKNFNNIVSLEDGDTPEPQKCEKPTISYNNGQLIFASATEGAEFVSEITDTDIKKNYEATVKLTATYSISVYATKSGYDNSETATATLCWIDKEPTTEGITDGVAQIPSKAVLIQSEGGILKVEGVDEGTQVAVYTPDGKQAGSAVCRNGAALVGTNIQPGNTAIVKIGEKSVKVIIK